MARVQSAGSKQTGGAVLAFTSANQGEGVSHVVQFFAEKLASQTGKPTLVVKAERLGSLRAIDLLDMPATKVGNLWSGAEETFGNGNGNGSGNGNGHSHGNGNGNGNGNGTSKSLDQQKLRELESKSGLELIQSLRATLGYTLIDCASISTSSEAAMLAPEVDGVVLVVEADRTKRDQIFRASRVIEMAKGNLMGLVLNRRRHVVPEWVYRRL
jgi:Mrp family chromosome partitioning ATPase